MVDSLARLLDGVIDYAGLFPPSNLDVEKAVHEFLQARRQHDWLVSRFAVPSDRLGDLARVLAKQKNLETVPLAVIGGRSEDRESWEEALEQDAQAMNEFQDAAEERAEIEAFEIRVPDHEGLNEYIRDLQGFNGVEVFVELPWEPEMADSVAMLTEAEWPGAKARTGGTDATAFPSSDQLAGFLHACVSLDQPFKLTAGLHHPLPRKDKATGAQLHGFLNVLGATALAISEDLSRRQIVEVLDDDRRESWAFDRNGLKWRDHQVSNDAIDEARGLLVCFGSCSVTEPLQGLVDQGFMPKEALK